MSLHIFSKKTHSHPFKEMFFPWFAADSEIDFTNINVWENCDKSPQTAVTDGPRWKQRIQSDLSENMSIWMDAGEVLQEWYEKCRLIFFDHRKIRSL